MGAVERQANSEETAMLTRRDILKAGLAGSAYGLLGPAFRRSAFGDSLPPSPATKPLAAELPIAPLAKSVAPFAARPDPHNCGNLDGRPALHVCRPRAVPSHPEDCLSHERAAPRSCHPY